MIRKLRKDAFEARDLKTSQTLTRYLNGIDMILNNTSAARDRECFQDVSEAIDYLSNK